MYRYKTQFWSVVEANVTMSSTWGCTNLYCFDGSKVVDGIYASIDMNELTSMAHTTKENHPWIQIRLALNSCISAVKIWNRNMDLEGMHVQS